MAGIHVGAALQAMAVIERFLKFRTDYMTSKTFRQGQLSCQVRSINREYKDEHLGVLILQSSVPALYFFG